RGELFRLAGAPTNEDIQYVLDLREIFPNGDGHGLHELHARCRQVLALLLDALIDRQQLGEPERGAHGHDTRSRRLGAPDVVEQVVQQLDGGILRVTGFTLFVQPPDFAIAQPQQSLDGYALFEAVLLQSLDDGSDHPPELEDRLARGNLFE